MANQELVERTRALLQANKIKIGISQAIDEGSGDKTEQQLKDGYIMESIEGMANIIKFNKASTLATSPLIFNGLTLEDLIKITSWEFDREFLQLRFKIETRLVETPEIFLGITKLNDGITYPFVADVLNWERDPITFKINTLEVVIGSYEEKKSYTLVQKYEWNKETGKYDVSRYGMDEGKKTVDVPEEYKNNETMDEIKGIVITNNLMGTSDIKNSIRLMADRGEFLYELKEKFQYLSAKILNKSGIMGKTEDVAKKEMKEKTFINLTSRESQMQAPLTVFNPTLPNKDIQDTIQFLEDEIFKLSLAVRPSGVDKKAQTNNLEQATKDQQAHNYMEFTKMLRSIQYTKYFILVTKELGITPMEDFSVNVELSTIQENMMKGDGKDEQ